MGKEEKEENYIKKWKKTLNASFLVRNSKNGRTPTVADRGFAPQPPCNFILPRKKNNLKGGGGCGGGVARNAQYVPLYKYCRYDQPPPPYLRIILSTRGGGR